MVYQYAVDNPLWLAHFSCTNDDTRAFLSTPARHDLARRIDCSYLAELVGDYRLTEQEALELAADLSYKLVNKAYKL